MSNQKLTQEEFERIESFITGSMSDTDQTLFNKSMDQDPKLKKQVEEFKLLIDGIEEQALRKKIQSIHRDIESNGLIETKTTRRIGLLTNYRYLAIAASIVILFGVGYLMIGNGSMSDRQLYDNYFSPDPGLLTPMSTQSDYELYRGMVDYKQGNYGLAINRWEKLLPKQTQNDTLNYYLGVSYLALGDVEEAIVYLESSIRSGNHFLSESHYYLGLAYLKEGQRNAAIEHLQQSDSEESAHLLKKLQPKDEE